MLDSPVCHLLHIQSIVHCVLPFYIYEVIRSNAEQRRTMENNVIVTTLIEYDCIDLCMRVGESDEIGRNYRNMPNVVMVWEE